MSGIFSPIVWADGEDPVNIPSADDLNSEWRDPFNFLLGYNRPIGFIYSTVGTSMTTTSEFTVGFNNEFLKRGGMVHSNVTNNQNLTVPYTGQYQGYCICGFDTISTLTTRLIVRVKKNGTTIATAGMKPAITGGWNINLSITTDAVANDVFTVTMQTTSGTAVMGSANTRNQKLALWYAGDYQ
jgi:hypothetical protein